MTQLSNINIYINLSECYDRLNLHELHVEYLYKRYSSEIAKCNLTKPRMQMRK